jgi:integrase
LEFVILTASRSGQVIKSVRDGAACGARFTEIDHRDSLGVVPADRMKAKVEFRVPLSRRTLAIVSEMWKAQRGPFVFPGHKSNEPISEMNLEAVLRRTDVKPYTVRGFRSSFRDWAAKTTDVPNHVVDMALAHVVGNKVEAAYRRGDLFDKRSKLMESWAAYCEQQQSANKSKRSR